MRNIIALVVRRFGFLNGVLTAGILWLALPVCGSAQTFIDSLNPQPRQAYVRLAMSSTFNLSPAHRILLDPAQPAWFAAAELNAGLRRKGRDTMQIKLWSDSDTLTNGIVLGVQSELINEFLAKAPDQKVRVTPTYPGREGYVMDGYSMRIIINGVDEAGLTYGVGTLLQLLFPTPTWWGLQPFRIIDAPEFPVRWFYQATNIQVPANITKAKLIWDDAVRRRLNGVHLDDYKFCFITDEMKSYFDSLKSLKNYAADRRLKIIPGVMPFGYSNGLLYHDPNLASGLPVKSQRFVVQGDSAALLPRVAVSVPNGGFENYTGNDFPNFTFIDQPGKISFADTDVKHSGNASIRLENFAQYDPQNGHGRISYWRNVSPFTEYHVSAWVRTENFQPAGAPTILVLGNVGYTLTYNSFNVPSTTNGWMKLDFTFNTLEADTIGIYWGVWEATGGKIWWDDLTFEETSFVNLLRRAGTPLTVQNTLRSVTYKEGIDYDTLRDPLLGVVPWKGDYDRFHTPPPLKIKAGAIRNGDTLLVSYAHMINIYESQVMITPSDPKVYDIIDRQFSFLDSLFQSDTYFLGHDEIRTLNWDDGDQQRHMTPGQLLADNVQKCMDIIHKHNPEADIWAWQDMFDEYHNAVKKNYYLVNGDLTGSADLLPKSLGMVNWNGRGGIVQNSLNFFSSKGFRQISAPYYDSDENQIRTWKEWTRDTQNFYGMMYTTWANDYSYLDPFGWYAWNHAPFIYHYPPSAIQGTTFTVQAQIAGDKWDKGWSLAGGKVFYRTAPGIAFLEQPYSAVVGQFSDITLAIPAGTTWIQWYITATDNRGWTTKVPFGDSVFYQIGAISTSGDRPDAPSSITIHGVYPNPIPAGGKAYLDWSSAGGSRLDMVVQDVLGREVKQLTAGSSDGSLHRAKLDLDGIRPGVYFLRVQSGEMLSVKRLVIQ